MDMNHALEIVVLPLFFRKAKDRRFELRKAEGLDRAATGETAKRDEKNDS